MMTEAEAIKKWCPFARVWNAHSDMEQATGWNRMPGGSVSDTNAFRAGCEMREVNCVASACMAWRWHWKRGEPPLNQESLGYCGIAGRPE